VTEPIEASAKSTAIRRAVRGGLLYAALSVAQRGMPFLLLPLFAGAMGPDEYGRIAFLTATVGVLGALLSAGLEPWVVRTYVQLVDRQEERARFLTTMGLFSFAMPLGGAVLAAMAFIAIPALSQFERNGFVLLSAFLAMALQTTSTVFTGAILRAEERFTSYAAVSLLQGVGGPLFAVVLVVGLGYGVDGWFAAFLVAAILSLVLGTLLVRHGWSRSVSPQLIVTALAFGLPLLPHSLAHWGLNLSDRIVLMASVGPADVGVYNVAYQLAAPIGLALIALRQGLMPMYAAASEDPALRSQLAKIATVQVHVSGLIGLAVGLLGPLLVFAAFPAGYSAAVEYIPWIALGLTLFGIYLVPVDALSLMLGATRWIWLPTAAAAIANVTLNVLLIPRFGAIVAAINTAVAYGILLAGISLLRRAMAGPRVPYDIPRMATGLAIMAVAYATVVALVPASADPISWVLRGALVLAAGLVVLVYDHSWWRRADHHAPRPQGGSRKDKRENSDPALVKATHV
jgi:O-antigen/teichoic acid export membrane protein